MLGFLGNRKPDEKAIQAALAGVEGCADISVLYEGGEITVIATVAGSAEHEPLRHDLEKRVGAVKGVKAVSVILTAERAGGNPRLAGTVAPAPDAAAGHACHSRPPSAGIEVPVRRIIAVSSGKGGVGKSTVAVNLAAALAARGFAVGLLDADIYGPSLPRLTGTRDQKPERAHEKIIPVAAHGIKLMSMGYLVAEDAPMIWRGPMVQTALKQLLRDVDWSGCDVLVIDMPPGTGDVQLTLAQQVRLDGAVIVSTPQDIALIDARKGLEMFRKTGVPILGIVENMSYFCCPACNTRTDVFGHGGARAEAEKAGVPFLGEIPLDAEIRALSDAGTPVVLANQASHQALAFAAVAELVSVSLALKAAA